MGAKAGPGGGSPKPKVTAKVLVFLEAIRRNPGISMAEAARVAGYASPRAHGHAIAKKHPQLVAEAQAEGLKALKMGAEEAEQVVCQIARDPTHRDRLKAAETMLKMHGKLSEKLNVVVDRTTLNKQLDELIVSMAAARQAERQVPGLQDGDALPVTAKPPN